jgi:hypothetical protein
MQGHRYRNWKIWKMHVAELEYICPRVKISFVRCGTSLEHNFVNTPTNVTFAVAIPSRRI